VLTEDGEVEPYRESWYRIGDMGLIDMAGRLHVHGRDRAVHRMGYTLYPEEIERKAERCGAPVRVLSFPHPRRGCDLVFVVLDPSGGAPADWHRTFRDLLPRYEQPNRVAVVPEFPLTSNGKVDVAALRAHLNAPADGSDDGSSPHHGPSEDTEGARS
jgi:acyl-CoA synthetase (AMP-forming)/AMP-acid ligase II